MKNTCEREREVTPPTIHTVVVSVKLHWHLEISNFILSNPEKPETIGEHTPNELARFPSCSVDLT